MRAAKPEVQIYLYECRNMAEADDIVDRCKKAKGSEVLFVGTNREGKEVVIHALTGEATVTPAVEYTGSATYPDGPRSEHIITYKLSAPIHIESSRT
jgi:hypothetical protein